MSKKIKILSLFLSLLAFLVIWFIPITNVSWNKEGEYQYCRYRFAVYKFWYIEADGEGNGKSDTYFGKIQLGEKIGGMLEYFGIQKIETNSK
jgi:hypothetical protein